MMELLFGKVGVLLAAVGAVLAAVIGIWSHGRSSARTRMERDELRRRADAHASMDEIRRDVAAEDDVEAKRREARRWSGD